jgi:hypothetical protein
MSSINVSHLLGKQVVVVHYTNERVSTIFRGRLEKKPNGDYFVYTCGPLLGYLKVLFNLTPPSVITFHWSAVNVVDGNTICLIHLSKEELIEAGKRVGVELSEEDFNKQ